jgi:NAD(P)-dependent dehydrogenase (short-subunit alcohol dehydrogenase family)
MNIVITGGSGGIGGAFVEAFATRPEVGKIIATCNRHPSTLGHPKVTWHRLDLTDETAMRDWAAQLDEIDWLINAAGILHTRAHRPEKSIRQIDTGFFLVFATISAKVGSIEDNRLGGWISYRASKAALNMSIKTLAIEWRRTLPNVAVVALHPGTTDTALSKPFQRNVPHGQLFTPEYSVNCMLSVLESLKPAHSGQFLAFDGERLPW